MHRTSQKIAWPHTVERGHTYRIAKRAIDLAIAVPALVISLPALLVIALIVRLTAGRPAVFQHERVGQYGRPFRVLKFRTMDNGVELSEPEQREFAERFKLDDDPRVTRAGRILRRLSLDELPQLLNVIGGSMSLVGPRPLVPEEIDMHYPESQGLLLQAKPGLTGLWQVSGRSDLDYPDRAELELEYVRTCSTWGDLKILLRTIPAVFRMRGSA